ncbi:hypothetical protein HMPREF1868_00208 [Olsenella sp. DNF00959]|nr:hypothetical protein HMPREF1868_00208 [Olsenella sp. DNF00959]
MPRGRHPSAEGWRRHQVRCRTDQRPYADGNPAPLRPRAGDGSSLPHPHVPRPRLPKASRTGEWERPRGGTIFSAAPLAVFLRERMRYGQEGS